MWRRSKKSSMTKDTSSSSLLKEGVAIISCSRLSASSKSCCMLIAFNLPVHLCLSDQCSRSFVSRVPQQVRRMSDQHFADSLVNRRKGVLQFGKDAVSKHVTSEEFLVSAFCKSRDDAVVIIYIKQYSLFLKTVEQAHVVPRTWRNRKRSGNGVGIGIQNVTIAVCQRSHYWNDLAFQ